MVALEKALNRIETLVEDTGRKSLEAKSEDNARKALRLLGSIEGIEAVMSIIAEELTIADWMINGDARNPDWFGG